MPTIRLLGASGLLLVAVVAIAACGGGASAAPAPTSVTITGTEFAYDPSTVFATAGSSVKLVLENKGTVEHDINIDALGLQMDLVKPGQTGELTVPDVKAGSYQFWCTVAGHKEAGMTGVLEVK
jgi:uncharacterized cupredoxin-like copper-binding protein